VSVPVDIHVVRPDELSAPDLTRWAAVQGGSPDLDSPFLSAQFATAVGRVRRRTRVAVLRDAAGEVGFLPFELARRGRGTALAAGLSDVQGVVAPERFDIDLGAVLRSCGLRVLEFDHFLAAQEAWLGTVPSRYVRQVSPVLDLAGGYEAYVREKQSSSRSLFQTNARKRRKLAREHGEVRLVFHQRDHALLDEVLAWKSAQYRRTGRRDRFADVGTRALVHDLLDIEEADFGAPLTVLYAGDAVVAAHLGVRSRRTVAWWFPVYDPQYAAYSPGQLLCLELAQAMEAHGADVLDLGKGDEPYKERLSNAGIALLSGAVARDRASHLVHTARHWPRERLLAVVLGSPRLRRVARETLRRVGGVRDAARRNRGF
jgi:CelD/BcsL family acetyltransferase involved in cellulose biosynthesis